MAHPCLYRETVCIRGPVGLVALSGATVRFYYPDGETLVPYTAPLYPGKDATVAVPTPYLTGPLGELEVWGDEAIRLRIEVDKGDGYWHATEYIDLEPDPATAASDQELSDAFAAHVAAADPHPVYLTEPEGDARYLPLAHGSAPDPHSQYATDVDLAAHAAAADPHPQYLTEVEGDARYYTETEADARYQSLAQKGVPNGYAALDGSGLLPPSYLPPLAITNTFVVASEAEMLSLVAQTGDVAIRTDEGVTYLLAAEPASVLGNWKEVLASSGAVSNVSVVRDEEFAPAAAATTVVLAALPTDVHAVTRNGVTQSQAAGHYTVAGQTVTFADAFVAGERVTVVYSVGTTVPTDAHYTKVESDARYVDVAGDAMTGALSISGKAVGLSPDAENTLEWRANGFYSSASGSGGGGGAVSSVNGEVGDVVLDAADVGALTQSQGDAAYSPLAHNHAALYEPLDSAYTKSEADARYSATAHNHAALYEPLDSAYTKAESDGRYSLTAHNHDGTYATAGHDHDADYAALAHSHTGTWAAPSGNPKLTVQASAPSSPATGDLWVW